MSCILCEKHIKPGYIDYLYKEHNLQIDPETEEFAEIFRKATGIEVEPKIIQHHYDGRCSPTEWVPIPGAEL